MLCSVACEQNLSNIRMSSAYMPLALLKYSRPCMIFKRNFISCLIPFIILWRFSNLFTRERNEDHKYTVLIRFLLPPSKGRSSHSNIGRMQWCIIVTTYCFQDPTIIFYPIERLSNSYNFLIE